MRYSRWGIYWGPLGLVWAFMFLGLPVVDGVLGNGSAIAEAQTLDQSFTGPIALGADINECCRFIAQTFTAGLSGTLSAISIDVRSPINSIFPLHVAIRTVVNGVPNTTVLGETTLSSSSASLSQLIIFPQVINIVAGVQYAIVVNYEGAPPPGPGQFQGIWYGEPGNQYPRGELYASFLDGISWFLPGGSDADVHFQTYMNGVKQLFLGTFSELQDTFEPFIPPAPKSREQLITELNMAGNVINAARQLPGITGSRSFQISVGILSIFAQNSIKLSCALYGIECISAVIFPDFPLPTIYPINGNVKPFQASAFQLFDFDLSVHVEKSVLTFINPGDQLVTDTPFFGIRPSFSIVEVESINGSSEFGVINLKVAGVTIDPEPFAAFNVKAEIKGNEFEVKGSFSLGTASDGINPLTQDVAMQVGTFFVMIPVNSFKEDGQGILKFEGQIDGVELEVTITPHGGDSFDFNAEGKGANLTGTANPIEVRLVIGDDAGSVSVVAELK